jgi:hypothetical protein
MEIIPAFSFAVLPDDFSGSLLSICILSTSLSAFFCSCWLGASEVAVALTVSHIGPYSPLKFTPLRSPNGNTLLRKVNIRPQKVVVVPIFERRRRTSFKVLSKTRAFPFCGTIPLVRRRERSSIQSKIREHDAIVWVSNRSWRTVNGKTWSQASAKSSSY